MRLTFIMLLTSTLTVFAQERERSQVNFGLEQDVLPYLTGGYYAAVWVGKNHFRARALTAYVNKPSFITPEGFKNNTVRAYAVLAEYFIKEKWRGWSLSAGLVHWSSSIMHVDSDEKVHYQNILLNGSVAYTIPIVGRLYVTPWAGLHLKVAGDDEVFVGHNSFKTPLLNPEASIKLGYFF